MPSHKCAFNKNHVPIPFHLIISSSCLHDLSRCHLSDDTFNSSPHHTPSLNRPRPAAPNRKSHRRPSVSRLSSAQPYRRTQLIFIPCNANHWESKPNFVMGIHMRLLRKQLHDGVRFDIYRYRVAAVDVRVDFLVFENKWVSFQPGLFFVCMCVWVCSVHHSRMICSILL